MAGREAHGQLAVGAPVQLRRSSGAGSLAAGEPAELGGQQPVGNEPVEVERGDGSGHSHRRGGLVLADGRSRPDDEPVQRPALRLRQRGDAGDALLEVSFTNTFLNVAHP